MVRGEGALPAVGAEGLWPRAVPSPGREQEEGHLVPVTSQTDSPFPPARRS